MSIVLVGGHERMGDEYKNIGNKHGCRIKVFTQMPARFEKSIALQDAIVLFTSTVSHKMMLSAVKEAKRKKIPVLRSHSSSGNALEETLIQLKTNITEEVKKCRVQKASH